MSSFQEKPTADQYEQASQWVSLLHDRNCSPVQHQAFQSWLNQDALHHLAYKEVEAYWQTLGGLSPLAQPQLESARAAVRQKSVQKPWLIRQPLAIAASILLIITTVPFARLLQDNGTYHTAKGEHKSLLLSDGSQIDINTETEVQVNYSLLDRNVKLVRGEALFTIKHDAEKPFQVVAGGGIIRDIGTQFNVYHKGDSVSVTVFEGEVSISHQQSSKPQNLTAGMQLAYGGIDHRQLAQGQDFKDIAAWREGKIIFKGQRLDTVLQELSRYHPVSLSTDNSNLGSLIVSGSFPTTDLNLALNTIAASLPVKITHPKSGKIILVAHGKAKK
jgi:transmembrane sensor